MFEAAAVVIAYVVAFNGWLNGIVWGPPTMILLAGVGLYLTFRLRFFQFTHLGFAWRNTFGQYFTRGDMVRQGAIPSFQSATAAIGATVGVGNIAGVATALALGGPGALFWMWMIALVGMATKFAEVSLGLRYRQVRPDGHVSGGAFYYIEHGLGWKWLAMVYAAFAGLAAFGIGNMVQANTMASALETGFAVPTWVTGLIAIVLVGAVNLGGVRRLGATAQVLVPFMAVAYVAAALIVLLINITALPGAIVQVFQHAFTPVAATGGFAGATVMAAMRYGVARGIFSNEAGLGSSSIIHAQAQNTPGRQGLWGIWEVFIDTLVLCSMTGLVILVTGVLPTGTTGAELASRAFASALPGIGGVIVLLGLFLFAYTSILTWGFYGEKSAEYLFGERAVLPYRIVFIAFIPVGALGHLQTVWDIADTLNGLMAIPNLVALIALGGTVAGIRTTLLGEAERPQIDEAAPRPGV